jgi:hypothetical protein
MEEQVMWNETSVLVFVGIIFATFAIGLMYADFQTRKFRE